MDLSYFVFTAVFTTVALLTIDIKWELKKHNDIQQELLELKRGF